MKQVSLDIFLRKNNSLPLAQGYTGYILKSMDWSKVFTAEQVYDYIIEFSKKNRQAPSLTDLQKNFHWKSKNAATKQVERLVKRGLIEKDKIGRIKFPSILLK